MATVSLACHRKEEETGGGRGRRKRGGREEEKLGRGQPRTGRGGRQGKSTERDEKERRGGEGQEEETRDIGQAKPPTGALLSACKEPPGSTC